MGDKVKVKVIAIKDGKLSLSIKEASDLMAKEVEEETLNCRSQEKRQPHLLVHFLRTSNLINCYIFG